PRWRGVVPVGARQRRRSDGRVESATPRRCWPLEYPRSAGGPLRLRALRALRGIHAGVERRNAAAVSPGILQRRRIEDPGGMSDTKQAPTRVLSADDEPRGRARIRMLLADEPWVEIVAETADGPSTVAAI